MAAGARALAASQGMDFVIPDHVQQLAVPLLAHRIVMTPAADIEGQQSTAVVEQIVKQIKAPR